MRSPIRRRSAADAPTGGFRPDIQGLRAIAVIAVVLNHVIGTPVGGFVGVDVFFVISGYLITSHLLREHSTTGRISLFRFFARRVKRLLPAAVVVVAATLLIAPSLFNAHRLAEARTDALWSMLFAANWHFERLATDYFASGGATSPFQHFWPLSVEEQFYVVWPVIILVVFGLLGRIRAGRRVVVLGVVLGVLVAASFAFSMHQSAQAPSSAYFDTLSRAWELGAGALLAITQTAWRRLPRGLGAALSWAGVALIVVAVITVDGEAGFPGPGALLPVIGATLVIVGGVRSQRGLFLLTNPLARGLGAISYSLYLWHFPIFILAKAAFPSQTGPLLPGAVIAVSIVAAIASYAFVERPFTAVPVAVALSTARVHTSRHGRRDAWRAWALGEWHRLRLPLIALLIGVNVAIVALGTGPLRPVAQNAVTKLPNASANAPSAEGEADALVTAPLTLAGLATELSAAIAATTWPVLSPSLDSVVDGPDASAAVTACSGAQGARVAACTFGPATATKTMVLLGDSTSLAGAQSFIDIATMPGSDWKVQVRGMFGCYFIDRTAGTQKQADAKCVEHNETTVKEVVEMKPDLAIITDLVTLTGTRKAQIAAAGKTPTAEWADTAKVYDAKIAAAAKKTVLLPSPPADKNVVECYTPTSVPGDCLSTVEPFFADLAASEKARAAASGLIFVDSRPFFCVDEKCPAFAGTTPVKSDDHHMTPAYATKIAPAVLEAFRAQGLLMFGAG